MKIIDGEKLIETIQKDAEEPRNANQRANIYFILGFLSGYVQEAEEVKINECENDPVRQALETINKALIEKNDGNLSSEDFYWWSAVLSCFDLEINRNGIIVESIEGGY